MHAAALCNFWLSAAIRCVIIWRLLRGQRQHSQTDFQLIWIIVIDRGM